MVGLATSVLRCRDALWASMRLLDRRSALAAFMCIGLIMPFFLPYLYDAGSETGFQRTLTTRATTRRISARGLNSSAWAHRWWVPAFDAFSEGSFPGSVIVLGVVGAVYVWRRGQFGCANDPSHRHQRLPVLALPGRYGPALRARRGPCLLAVLRTGCRPLPVLYDALPVFSFLRAPARIGLLVTLALTVFAAAAIAQIAVAHAKTADRRRRAAGRGVCRVVRISALAVPSGRAVFTRVFDAGDAAPRRRGRVSLLVRRIGLSAARGTTC